MNLLQRFVGAITGKGFDPNQSQSQWRGLGSGPNSTVSDIAKTLPGMTYPVLTTLADDLAGIKLYIEMKDGGETIKRTAHPLLQSIRFPNKGTSSNKLLKLWLLSRAVYGEAFWLVYPYKLNVYRIIPVDPRSVQQIEFDEEGTPTSFTCFLRSGGTRKFSSDDIIYFSTPSLADFRRGFAPASVVTAKVDSLAGAERYNNRFFANDATPSLIYKAKNAALSFAQKMGIKADWIAQFRGADNAHKMAVIDGDVEVQTIGTLPKDLAFKEIYTVTEDGIRANWRVNKTLLGLTEGINRATLEGAEVNHAKHVLTPLFEEFVSELELKFLTKFYTESEIIIKEINIRFVSPVTDDIYTKAQIAQIGVGAAPFMSINEGRSMVNLPSEEGEEYDKVPVPMDFQPIDTTTQTDTTTADNTGKSVDVKKKALVDLVS